MCETLKLKAEKLRNESSVFEQQLFLSSNLMLNLLLNEKLVKKSKSERIPPAGLWVVIVNKHG